MTDLLGAIAPSGDDEAVVTFDRRYPTDAADLWDAATSADRLARWFAPVMGDLRDGGSFSIHFDDGDVPQCRVVACDAPRSYDWEWDHEGRTSAIHVEVVPDGDGARLLLRHTRLTRAAAPEYGAGWQAYLHSLDAHLGAASERDWWADFGAARTAYAERLAGEGGR